MSSEHQPSIVQATDPTARYRDLLCKGLCDPNARPDWEAKEFETLARDERVHLLLASRSGSPSLAHEVRAARVVEKARARELRIVIDHLADRGIRPILLKGVALAYTHYERPELRPRGDTDIMIPVGARNAVAAALRELGYERLPEIDAELATGQFHFAKGQFQAFDIHWRLSNVRAFADLLTYEELAQEAVPISVLGANAFGPSPVHALALACVHRIAHHNNSEDLLWLYDIHLLGSRFSLDKQARFADLAADRRIRRTCGRGLALADAAFGGIDSQWIATLSRPADKPERGEAFLNGGLRRIDILREDLAATPWQSWLQLLREHLFPRPSYMYARYGWRQPLALPFMYLHRAVTAAPTWFRR